VIDAQAWAADYPDPNELSEVFSGGNIPAIRDFLARKIDPDIYGLRKIIVSNQGIFNEYEQKLSDRRATHQLLFSPCMNGSDRVPYIPGSSIKGALRTAVIDWLDQNKNLRLKAARSKDGSGGAYRKSLENILGPTTDSAFKQLKITDVIGFADSTLLVEPLEIRCKEGKSATPKNKCEVMPSRLLGVVDQSTLYVRISIGEQTRPADQRLTLRDGQSWDWSELAQLANAYFLKRFQEEKAKFYGLPNFAKARPAIERLEAELNCGKGQMLLRLGHYSQVEFVTVEDNKPLTRKLKDGTPMPYGTTRTLANGLFPFGWVRLTPCSEVEYKEGMAGCETANRTTWMHREGLREKMLLDRQQQIEKIRQNEEKKRQEAEADAQRQAELDAMPEKERQLFFLEQGDLNENQVVELFNQLDSMEPPIQIKTAKALKSHWQRTGKWKKKECSKKQIQKVAAIKHLLGES
jgi:CRISPR type III-A-associated RAMP protein Csm5